ncbi:silicon efflux transporter LSI2-like [Rhodamnia argentea]|uniref:Silicon efflux transporter LSI2-like n=1 Tax=Rhodamnia argentea TaxID=178133 RepID=A0A8B8PSH6_9MYRT|nr:silicon efflux transporter LSI2-like [Rhodamnia argentea]XP_030537724.1 silicon efflux transporter LSI2-like [Rhodamnia argentea]
MSSVVKVILGSIAFAIFWVLAVFPVVPFLPIGRTAGSLLGALLMVVFGILDPVDAYDAIDLQVLALLFGTMVVSVYLERADMFQYLGMFLSWKSMGAKDLMCRICVVSAVSSALFTNDTSCVVLTEFVLKIARQENIPPHPLLLALASSANIGSSATPIGNPQNLVIAVESALFSFGSFMTGMLPAVLVGLVLNALVLLVMYWKVLSIRKEDEGDVNTQMLLPATMFHVPSNLNENRNAGHADTPGLESGVSLEERETTHLVVHEMSEYDVVENTSGKWRRILWKTCVYLVVVGMLVSLLMGLNMSWTATGAALALIALGFEDAQPSLAKVSYSLLVFFSGMFITVEGFEGTGIPSSLWAFAEGYVQVTSAKGVAVLALVILVLSNSVSNVPTVLLLGARFADSKAFRTRDDLKKAWLILAWVSTVSGNLSLLGSAANLIVCEQARRSPHLAYNLSFWRHLKFGVPSTILVTVAGLTLIS